MRTEYILDREVDLILAALTETNRLVMRTALHTGLRISDVLAFKPEDLRPHFWVTEQKTGKRRQNQSRFRINFTNPIQNHSPDIKI